MSDRARARQPATGLASLSLTYTRSTEGLGVATGGLGMRCSGRRSEVAAAQTDGVGILRSVRKGLAIRY